MPICHLFSQSSLTPGLPRVLYVPLCGCTIFASFSRLQPFYGFPEGKSVARGQSLPRPPSLLPPYSGAHAWLLQTFTWGMLQVTNWYSEKESFGELSSKYLANRKMPVERPFSSHWRFAGFSCLTHSSRCTPARVFCPYVSVLHYLPLTLVFGILFLLCHLE